jgi:hypothetical protein
MTRIAQSVFATAGLVVACTRAPSKSNGTTMRDSAGIAIAETGLSTQPSLGWTVADSPMLSIGGRESDTTNIGTMMIMGIGRLSNGRIVVAQQHQRRDMPGIDRAEIYIIGRDGSAVKRIGRVGKGPGEFTNLASMVVVHDSIFAFDDWQSRLSIFNSSGNLLAVTAFHPPLGASLSNRFADGSWIATGLEQKPIPTTPEVIRTPVLFFHVDVVGSDTLGTFPDWPGLPDPRGGRVAIELGPKLGFATSDSLLYIGTGDTYEIRVYTEHGRLVRIIRRSVPARRLTQDTIAAYRDALLAEATNDEWRQSVRNRLKDQPWPSVLPAHTVVSVDSNGLLWVRRFAIRHLSKTVAWDVFSHDGKLLGSVTMPADLYVREIGNDYVLGVRYTDDGSHVEEYALRKQ